MEMFLMIWAMVWPIIKFIWMIIVLRAALYIIKDHKQEGSKKHIRYFKEALDEINSQNNDKYKDEEP